MTRRYVITDAAGRRWMVTEKHGRRFVMRLEKFIMAHGAL